MTDSHLRNLERAFRASGSVEDEAAWLRARVQAGELNEEHVRLAAILGDLSAQRTLGVPSSTVDGVGPIPSLGELGPWPGDVAVSAVIELTVLLLEQVDPSTAMATAPALSAALRCLEHGTEEAATDAKLAPEQLWGGEKEKGRSWLTSYLAGCLAHYASDLSEGVERKRGWDEWIESAATRAAEFEPAASVRKALVRGACRRLLGREANDWLRSLARPSLPEHPPLESSLGTLHTTLRWAHEHLAAFMKHRGQDEELAEQELRYLVSEVRDARREADRVSEVLRLWAKATGERDADEE